jgi:hypothetical protein
LFKEYVKVEMLTIACFDLGSCKDSLNYVYYITKILSDMAEALESTVKIALLSTGAK